MKDQYSTIWLLLLVLLFRSYPVLAGRDVAAHEQEIRDQAQQAAETAGEEAAAALRNIRDSIQQIQQENQARIQDMTRQIEILSKQTKQQTMPGKIQTGEDKQDAGKETPNRVDPYDSEEAQKKAEAALLRTGPTGPDIIPVISTADPVVVSADTVMALKSRIQGNGERLKTDVVSLDKTISDLGAKVTKTAIIVDLQSDVLFDFDKATIKPVAEKALAKVALVIRKKGSGTVRIDGHTDAIGSKAYNQKLSEQRAEAVKNWLVKHGGIAEDRLVTTGFGETKPVAPNTHPDGSDNPDGRRLNRRVVITIPTAQ